MTDEKLSANVASEEKEPTMGSRAKEAIKSEVEREVRWRFRSWLSRALGPGIGRIIRQIFG